MGSPYFSPRVPYVRAKGLASAARQLLARPSRRVLRPGLKHVSILLFLAPGWSARIQFHPLTFWSSYKWYVVIAIGTFLIQAFLIARLLVMQTRRRQAEEKFAKSFKSNPQPISLTRVADGLYVA